MEAVVRKKQDEKRPADLERARRRGFLHGSSNELFSFTGSVTVLVYREPSEKTEEPPTMGT